MSRDLSYLDDILNSAKNAIAYLSKVNYKEFIKDEILQDAVIRRIEIIGEASSRVSDNSQNKYPELPWREMKGMRNLLIHEYDAIDLEEVWNTVKNELPNLVQQINTILNNA
jgi:uncharacterized protein with HEPN domain